MYTAAFYEPPFFMLLVDSDLLPVPGVIAFRTWAVPFGRVSYKSFF